MTDEIVWGKPKRETIEVDLKPQLDQEIDLVDQKIILETPEISLISHKDK